MVRVAAVRTSEWVSVKRDMTFLLKDGACIHFQPASAETRRSAVLPPRGLSRCRCSGTRFLGRRRVRQTMLPAHFLHALHHFGMASPRNACLFRCAVEFGMNIVTTFAGVLWFFHGNTVRVGPRVLANAGYLPGDFYGGFVRLYAELMVGDLTRHNSLSKLPDHGELITKIAIQGFEPLRQRNDGITIRVGDDIAVVDVHHVGRFDK